MPRNILIPKGIDRLSHSIFTKNLDDAYYFLHLLFRRRVTSKRKRDKFIRLNASSLRKQLPNRKYLQIIEAWIALGVVERDLTYVPGVRSRGYRLAKAYLNAEPRKFELTKVCLLQRLDRWESDKEAAASRDLAPVHHALRQNLRSMGIDREVALEMVKTRRDLGLREAERAKGRKRRRMIERTRDQYHARVHQIEAFADQQFHFTVDRYGRVHTNFTNLASEIRGAFSVSGGDLVEIDLCNSQPLLLATLARSHYRGYASDEKQKKVGAQNTGTFTYKGEKHPSNAFSTLSQNLFHKRQQEAKHGMPYDVHFYEGDGWREDELDQELTELEWNWDVGREGKDQDGWFREQELTEFLRVCEQGTIYEMIMDSFPGLSRRMAKKEFFRYLFGHAMTRLGAWFCGQFRAVHDFVCRTKREDYRHLAHELQRIESEIMIHGVAARLVRAGKFVTTIHDSIIVVEEDAEFAQGILKEEFGKYDVQPVFATVRLRQKFQEDRRSYAMVEEGVLPGV